MTQQVTGESIPKNGLKDKIFLYMEHVSGEKKVVKFVVQGLIFTIFKEIPTIFGTYIRPKAYRRVLGSIGEGCLIEKSVRLGIPSSIHMENRVFLGEYSFVDPGSKDNKIVLKDDVYIGSMSTIRGFGQDVIIGESVHLGRNTYINATGGVEIGRDTMFGPNVSIISGNHPYQDRDVPIRLQGVLKEKVIIGDDVWLAANVTVVPGVTVGTGSVIGAGAVVTKNIPPYSLAVGVPAKVIGKRGNPS